LKAINVPQASWPETTWLVDPNDYLRPLMYELH
jgi:hypothetical protein